MVPFGSNGLVTQSVKTRLFVPGAAPDEFAPAWAIVGRRIVLDPAVEAS